MTTFCFHSSHWLTRGAGARLRLRTSNCCCIMVQKMADKTRKFLSEWAGPLMVKCVIWLLLAAFGLYFVGILMKRRGLRQLPHLRQPRGEGDFPLVVGFFHPYCNAGGGGERVLWVAIRALQEKYKRVRCVIYTGDVTASPEEIIDKARQRFNIILPNTDRNYLEFVYLHQRKWVEAKPYPFMTLLCQSLGSLVLGVEALWKFVPDIYIDSMGYAVTLPLFKLMGRCSVGCYVHYPTISTDMLERVSQRTVSYNNASFISRSPLLSYVKLVYYRLFAFMYGSAGKMSDLVLVNSSWTRDHILSIWKAPSITTVIYPPCDTTEFLKLSLEKQSTPKTIVSVAQFRPEKDHPLQIKAFSEFLSKLDNVGKNRYKLVLVGSCRNEEDSERVENLKTLTRDLKVEDFVEFRLNVSFEELKQCLGDASVGLHTMWNEHFGIGVVEMMAAGTITLAHDSGGPKMDIVRDYDGQRTGYLASDVTSYADAMQEIFSLEKDEVRRIQLSARHSVERFSDERFQESFIEAMQCVMG